MQLDDCTQQAQFLCITFYVKNADTITPHITMVTALHLYSDNRFTAVLQLGESAACVTAEKLSHSLFCLSDNFFR